MSHLNARNSQGNMHRDAWHSLDIANVARWRTLGDSRHLPRTTHYERHGFFQRGGWKNDPTPFGGRESNGKIFKRKSLKDLFCDVTSEKLCQLKSNNYSYSVFQGFSKAKFAYGGSILSSSQFLLLPQLPQKIKLTLKVVKVDSKIIISLPKI